MDEENIKSSEINNQIENNIDNIENNNNKQSENNINDNKENKKGEEKNIEIKNEINKEKEEKKEKEEENENKEQSKENIRNNETNKVIKEDLENKEEKKVIKENKENIKKEENIEAETEAEKNKKYDKENIDMKNEIDEAKEKIENHIKKENNNIMNEINIEKENNNEEENNVNMFEIKEDKKKEVNIDITKEKNEIKENKSENENKDKKDEIKENKSENEKSENSDNENRNNMNTKEINIINNYNEENKEINDKIENYKNEEKIKKGDKKDKIEEHQIEVINNQIVIENKGEKNKKENQNLINTNSNIIEPKQNDKESKIENNNNESENIIKEKPKEEKNKNIIINESKEPQEFQDDIKTVKLKEVKDQDKYLVNLEENKEYEKIISEQMKPLEDSDDSDEEEEETFPFRFVGDVQKKGELFGFFNSRYLEIDSEKGLIKRYASSKQYPTTPMETIPIKSLKTLKKVKKLPNQEFYEFQLGYIPEGKNKEKIHIYRVRHVECRTKWFESLTKLYKHLLKGEPLPPINKNKLMFIDDQVGINQEIKQNTNKKKKQITDNNTVFLRNFKIISELGVGAFGTVFKVQHILTEKIYAMKVMNKNLIIQKKYLHYVVSEFEIMKSLTGFPFVIDLHYCFQSANYLFMVIDICPGGDFDNLKYINNLKLFFAELVLAFEHIHKHHVVYRDLKPENILLDPYGHIKVCDFNLAKAGISKHKRATSFCGSPMYLSPEMLDPEGVDQRADIYGIGLIIYELVTDKPAYMAPNLDALYDKIKNNKIDFDDPKLKGDMKDLLQKILVANPDDRISIEDIKKHPYFKDIDFEKVLKREYGPIIIKKKGENEFNPKVRNKAFSKNIMADNKDSKKDEKKEKVDEDKKTENDFKEKQKKLDANKDYSFLDGKISVREMKKDQKRAMKNYVREFYYIKHEDEPQTEEFHLTVNGLIDIQGI